uniref:Rho guanine nucleotide exchange factor 28 n=1 Tax=Canis lupus familiaris TaxID=9615 RepID=A0A8C0LWE9_CANLF
MQSVALLSPGPSLPGATPLPVARDRPLWKSLCPRRPELPSCPAHGPPPTSDTGSRAKQAPARRLVLHGGRSLGAQALSSLPSPAQGRGGLMIHWLLVTFWITGRWCPVPAPRGWPGVAAPSPAPCWLPGGSLASPASPAPPAPPASPASLASPAPPGSSAPPATPASPAPPTSPAPLAPPASLASSAPLAPPGSSATPASPAPSVPPASLARAGASPQPLPSPRETGPCRGHPERPECPGASADLGARDMDSDSDSPLNYSWPSFPKMKTRRRAAKPDHSFDVFKKPKHPPAFFAAGGLSDVLNGGDEVYANCMVIDQVGDLDINYINLEGISTDACAESMGSTLGPQNCEHILAAETSHGKYPLSENKEVISDTEAQQSFPSPSSSYASNFDLSFGLHGFEKEQSLLKKRSSSLDALDADSEGEGHSERSHICYTPASQSSSRTGIPSGDELDSFETATEPDFSISRTESLSLSSSLQLKESLLPGVRSRSYSCSSPKISLGKTRLVRDFTVCNSGEEQRAFGFPEPARERRIQEEEWDKYIIPAKSESEKYKVSRTFSFLMNRMTSPRNKSKTKSKDAKDKEKPSRHQFVPGTFSGVLQCSVCDKTLLGKESSQCSNCNANVHKGCKDAAPPCTKKFQEKYNKNKPQTILGNSSFRDIPQPSLSLHPSSSMPIGLPTGRKEASAQAHPLSRSVPGTALESFRRSGLSLESESDGNSWRSRSHSDELLQSMGSSPSTESFLMEDVVDSSLWSDLSSDAQELEAESWSLVVDPSFCNKQEKDVIKRQDVIFELMQTEMHHIQTLLIMSEIFRKGMKEELQLDHSTVDKIFPCLDELLEIHRHFFYSMKERRQESCAGGDRNFVISRIGDILVQQFSEENANQMKKIYGEFCSHHKEAVSLYKELQQNKKFQNFIKLRNSNLLARRRGIPECILLVTQRITKYPVLVERILQYTKERSEEHQDLCKALCLIKDMIAAVDLKVSEYEKNQKWLEILNKIENKTYTKLKNGHVFRKQALISKERTLLYDGLVYWKTATGRFKDILALLLTDVLLFLQEKDQKYIFAAVDQKPSVISLQKLIAREVANEERGMFLISASSAGPEMYEIHTNSKEERNNWMRRIQQAVESCPEEEGGRTSESDEERRKAEARVAKIQQCQEILSNQDQQICAYLEEKLHIYAELGELSGFKDVHLEPHLLIKPDPGEPPQAASLLAAALREAESLQVAVKASQAGDARPSPEEGSAEPAVADAQGPPEEPGSSPASLVTEGTGGRGCWDVDPGPQGVGTDLAVSDAGEKVEYRSFTVSSQSEIIQAIQNLTRLLYSLQAALTIQDSHIQVHRLLLQQAGLPASQEEHGELARQREELACPARAPVAAAAGAAARPARLGAAAARAGGQGLPAAGARAGLPRPRGAAAQGPRGAGPAAAGAPAGPGAAAGGPAPGGECEGPHARPAQPAAWPEARAPEQPARGLASGQRRGTARHLGDSRGQLGMPPSTCLRTTARHPRGPTSGRPDLDPAVTSECILIAGGVRKPGLLGQGLAAPGGPAPRDGARGGGGDLQRGPAAALRARLSHTRGATASLVPVVSLGYAYPLAGQ